MISPGEVRGKAIVNHLKKCTKVRQPVPHLEIKGRFVFEKLPPVPSVVRSILNPWRDFPITSSRQVPLDLRPGKQHQVSLGGEGIMVTGNVNLVGDNADQIQFRYGLNSIVRIQGGVSTPVHAQGKLQFKAGSAKEWNERLTSGLEPNVTRESFFVKIRDDGTFLVSGVQPGRHRFLIKEAVWGQAEAVWGQATVFSFFRLKTVCVRDQD